MEVLFFYINLQKLLTDILTSVYNSGIRYKRGGIMNLLKGIPKTHDAGIYMIFNENNHRVYIGQTSDLHKRALQHSYELKNGQHANKQMQIDFSSGHKMRFSILELVNKKMRDEDRRTKELQYEIAFKQRSYSLYNAESEKQIVRHLIYNIAKDTEMKVEKRFGKPLYRLKQYGEERLETVLKQNL